MSITNAKINEYQVLISHNLAGTLGSNLAVAMKPDAIRMLEAQAAGDGSTNQLSVWVGWIKNNPLAMKFLTTTSVAEINFQKVISGTVSFTTAADGLPSTYVALHAENTANEPKLAGLLALRAAGVDSTFKDDGANLGAGTSGTVLTDAYIMGLYTTWGAAKFNSIFNSNVLKAIINESNTSYDTLAEISTLYSSWSHTAVSATSFFNGLSKLIAAGLTTMKVSDLLPYADSASNFSLFTSDPVITLMTSAGGSFATIAALPTQTLTDLTSVNAITAIKSGGADYTHLSTVYAASSDKYFSLLSNNSINLMKSDYTGINYQALSTLYGTTYSIPAYVKYNSIINPTNFDLLKNGVTLAHLGAAYDAGKLNDFTPAIKTIMANDHIDYDGIFADLVAATSSSHYSGLETLAGIS